MATARFLHVSFNFEGKPPEEKKLTDLFNKALDWVRYAPNCWILYTTTEPREWSHRLHKILDTSHSIFIIEMDIQKHTGYMHKFVWDWLAKDRIKKS